MTQRIDLYQELRQRRARQGRGVAPAATALIAGAVILVVHVGFAQRELNAQRAELTRIQADTQRLQRLLVEKAKPADTAAAAEDEAQVAALERVAARLSGGTLARTEGFSATLTALAQASTEGVWLTGITLENTTDQFALEGKALDATRVPLLLAALKRQPRFAGTEFAKLDLARADDAGRDTPEGTVRFRIATAALGRDSSSPKLAAAATEAAP